jgi:hypothetical protein
VKWWVASLAVVVTAVAVSLVGPATRAAQKSLSHPSAAQATASERAAIEKPRPGCEVDPSTLTSPGCRLLRTDTSEREDPRPGLWGSIDCVSPTRYRYMRGNGYRGPTATGAKQHNDAFRRLRVYTGDNLYGQRCELGRNTSTYGVNRRNQTDGTFALYYDGDHKITYFSERYPSSFSMRFPQWQTVAQMKQAQPSDNGGGGPILELQISGRRLRLVNRWHQVWTTPAPAKNTWIRYALNVHYSPDPSLGSVRLFVDLNGDGDALDRGERSPRLRISTMLREIDGPNGTGDGFAPGDTIPDHLRLGVYTSSLDPCPPPSGCAVDVDDVQVLVPKG